MCLMHLYFYIYTCTYYISQKLKRKITKMCFVDDWLNFTIKFLLAKIHLDEGSHLPQVSYFLTIYRRKRIITSFYCQTLRKSVRFQSFNAVGTSIFPKFSQAKTLQNRIPFFSCDILTHYSPALLMYTS